MIHRDLWDGNWDHIGQFKDRLMGLSLQDRTDTICYFVVLRIDIRRELIDILADISPFVLGAGDNPPQWDRREVDEWKKSMWPHMWENDAISPTPR